MSAIKIIQGLARKSLIKDQGSGIRSIPSVMEAEAKAGEIAAILQSGGMPLQQLDDYIRSEKDLLKYLNIIKNANKPRVIAGDSPEGKGIMEALLGKRGEVVDMAGKKLDTSQGIMGGKSVKELMDSGQVTKGARGMKKSKKVQDREMFQDANKRLTSDVDSIIKNIQSMEPITAMKEANSVIARKGKYKNLTQEQSKKILQDTEDHIFERYPIEDPEDFETGGRAGFGGGGLTESDYLKVKDMLNHWHDYKNSGGTLSKSAFANAFFRENNADGGVAGLLGERTGFKGGGMDAKDFGKSKSKSTNREKGIMSRGKGPKGTTGNINNTGGGGGNNNTGGGGGGGPPGTNTGGGGGTTTTTTDTQPSFRELVKQKQIIERLKSLGLIVDEEDLALSGASKVGKGLYSILKRKPDKPGYNFGVEDLLSPDKASIYGNYFNKNFLKDSDYKLGFKQNLKEAIEGNINPQLQLERRLRDKNITGTLDKEGNFNLGITMPTDFFNKPPGKVGPRNFQDRFAPDISEFNFGDMTGITSQAPANMQMADALTTPTEGKLGLNLTDYSTLKNVGYSDGQIEELQLNPNIDTQEVIRDIKGPIFAGADGGPARQNFAMGRRAFLKMLAGTGAGIAGLKSGIIGTGGKEVTKKAVTETVKSAGSTPPPYFFNLVKKIKTMGDDTLATQDKAIAKKYKDYVMEEDFAGNIEIIKKGADDMYPEDVYMSYKVDKVPVKGKKGSAKVEEYEEYTARPDMDGKMKDVEDGVPDDVIEEGTMFEDDYLDFGKTKKASGGIARMLGE